MLIISLSEPLRRTTARSTAPVSVIVRRNPWAIESTPTNTSTTPAMPKAAASDEPLRCGTVRIANAVTVAICISQLRRPAMGSSPPQGIRDAQSHGLPRRQQAGQQAQGQHQQETARQ